MTRLRVSAGGQMGSEASQENAQAKTLRAWHLALLRFAVTREASDKQAAWAIAAEIDRLGSRDRDPTSFAFFRTTTRELCAAVLQPDDSTDAIVRRHLARMQDDRLKRAFQAALEPARPAVVEAIKTGAGRRRNVDLWKGLEPRRTGTK
jgi:hypothetical protein